MGEPVQAHSQLQRVMRIQERHDVPRHEFSGTLCNMAAVNAALGEHEKSKVLYQSVLATQERQYGQWYPEIATTLSNLAMVSAFPSCQLIANKNSDTTSKSIKADM